MRSFFLPTFCLLTLFSVAADWNRFRGPNGTGISTEKNIPVKWTASDTLFKVELPGTGHSSPIIVGNRIYLLSATKSERLVLCYDAVTGKQIWKKAVPGQVAKHHAKSSLASATPCSDGERLYCVFWDGKNVGLYTYDLTGKLVWEQDLGAFKSQHGPGFSPMVADGKVIVNNDQDGKATLFAFDAKSGKPAWQVKRTAFRACYSTPIIHEQGAEGKELIVTSTAGLSGYNISTGKEIWHYDWSFPAMPLRTVGSSVMSDGLVFGCSGDGSGDRSMIAVKLGGKGDITKTNLVWSKDQGSPAPYVPSLIAYQGYLYGIHDKGTAFCFKARTGEQLWQNRLSGNVSSSPILVDGKIYLSDEKGDIFVIEASPVGMKVLAKNNVGEKIMSTPAVANGRLYLRGEKNLYCIGKK